MEFFQIKKPISKQKQEKKEFDVQEYLNKCSVLSNNIDIYFINEPVKLLDSAIIFDKITDIESVDVETSLLKMIENSL